MARSVIFLFLLSTSVLLLPSECRKKAKFVTTLIDAKWHQTPLVLEISEFLAEENNNLFWSFVDDVANLEPAFSTLGNNLFGSTHFMFIKTS
jgi:UDP-glucose:glycoprotein glucosyltransferase